MRERKLALRVKRLEDLCSEIYQVVGVLADAADVFEHKKTQHVLDNLSAASRGIRIPHKNLLPYQISLMEERT